VHATSGYNMIIILFITFVLMNWSTAYTIFHVGKLAHYHIILIPPDNLRADELTHYPSQNKIDIDYLSSLSSLYIQPACIIGIFCYVSPLC
jgi:hypothetical protein